MKNIIGCLLLTFMLTACMSGAEKARVNAIYDKYDAHCKQHAKDLNAEADEQLLYDECMNFFVTNDPECPHCITDQHMSK